MCVQIYAGLTSAPHKKNKRDLPLPKPEQIDLMRTMYKTFLALSDDDIRDTWRNLCYDTPISDQVLANRSYHLRIGKLFEPVLYECFIKRVVVACTTPEERAADERRRQVEKERATQPPIMQKIWAKAGLAKFNKFTPEEIKAARAQAKKQNSKPIQEIL